MKYFLIVLLVCVGQICGTPKNEPQKKSTVHPSLRNHTEHGTEHPQKGSHHGWFRGIDVRYYTWSPVNNRTISNYRKVDAPVNSSFYDVMIIAQQQDPKHFAFSATLYPGMGHYVTSIGGVQQDKINGIYWMLYVMKQKPNMKNPPTAEQLSPVGVDQLIVQPKTSYLFWYKKI